MSDDKKRDRALQRRVRARQAKTGESYQAAWQQLIGNEGPVPPNASKDHRRVPLPMSTRVPLLPGQSAHITVHPQLASFWPDRLLINNPEHWDVESFVVGNWKNWKESEYSKFPLIEAEKHAATTFSLDVWQSLIRREVHCGEDIVLVVTYTGSNELGEPFFAALFGWEDAPPPSKSTDQTDERVVERISERAVSKHVQVRQTVKLPLTVASTALFVDRFTITDAKDWIVNDIAVCGKSILEQAGELPGEMFSGSASVVLAPLAKGDLVEVVATYLGNQPSTCLGIELSGAATSTCADRAISCFLPMSIPRSMSIVPTQRAQITGRPQVRGFLPERLVIADADDWIINDIMVGIRSQLAQSGDIPGQAFASRTVGGHVRLDPVLARQDFIIVTTNISPKDAGFFCGVQGRLVEDHP